jgi:hypothetical protein
MRCAYCHDDDPGWHCYECGSLLHADCWELAGRCPTIGCQGLRRPPALLATSLLGAVLLVLTLWVGELTVPRYWCYPCCFTPEYRVPHPFGAPRELEPLTRSELLFLGLPWELLPEPEPRDTGTYCSVPPDRTHGGPWTSVRPTVADLPRREERSPWIPGAV